MKIEKNYRMEKRINNIITAYFFFNRRAEKARRPKEAPLLLVSSCSYKIFYAKSIISFRPDIVTIFGPEISFNEEMNFFNLVLRLNVRLTLFALFLKISSASFVARDLALEIIFLDLMNSILSVDMI